MPNEPNVDTEGKRPSQVREQMDRLEQIRERLADQANDLVTRLGIVVRDEPPREPGSSPTEEVVSLARELRDRADSLEGTAECLSGILDRLEL